ncbi:MAG: SDR family NAD(P)-dependent oxidoreductase, partial [Rhodospirillales bacterium]|nr:SDR family NAD(P)-dependent oxidoreductase [Rhodospirillales bacterium]
MFKGRTAAVTGGARGIGLACATALHGLGARIALWDRDSTVVAASAAALPGAVGVAMDVTSESSVA